MCELDADYVGEPLSNIPSGSLFIEVRGGMARAVVLGSGHKVLVSQQEEAWAAIRQWVESSVPGRALLCVDELVGDSQEGMNIAEITRVEVATRYARSHRALLIVFDWDTTCIVGPQGDPICVGKGERTRETLGRIFSLARVEDGTEKLGDTGNLTVICNEEITVAGISGATRADEIAAALEEALVFGAVSVLEDNSGDITVVGVDAWHKRAAELVGAVSGSNVRCLIDDFWPAMLLESGMEDRFIPVEVSGGQRGPRGRYRAWRRCQAV